MTVARPADHADAHLISHSFMQVKFPLIIFSFEAALAHLFDRMKQQIFRSIQQRMLGCRHANDTAFAACSSALQHEHAALSLALPRATSSRANSTLGAPTPGKSPSTTRVAFTRELERSHGCDRIRLPAS
jgi:hypothetical protein